MPKRFRGPSGCSKSPVTYLMLLVCLYLSKKKDFYLQTKGKERNPQGSLQLCCHEKVVQKWCSQVALKKHEQGRVRYAEAPVGWHEAGH